MASSLSPSEPWPIGSIVLLVVACCLYALLLIPLLDAARSLPPLSGEGRYSAAWSELFALLFGGLLWLDLGTLLWVGAHRGEMPHWAALSIGTLYLLSGLAGGFAIDRIHKVPGGWLVVVPILLPPLVALFAFWARLPALHMALPPDMTSGVMIGAIALATVAVVPLSALDEQQGPARWATPELQAVKDAILEQRQQEKEAEFQKLTDESSLEDYLEFVNGSYPNPLGEGGVERALEGARRAKSRQSDAVMLLNGFKIDRLDDLWRLDLAATPELGAAYGDALQRYAAREIRFEYTVAALERQLPNLKWLVGQHCDLDASLAAIDATLQQNAKTAGAGGRARVKPFLATLAELRQAR